MRALLKQILEAAPHKATAVRPFTSHLTIQNGRIRYTEHCWRSKDELITDVLQWTTTYGHTSLGRPALTYIHQLWADTGFCLKDLSRVMAVRDGCQERAEGIRAVGTPWWWYNANKLNFWERKKRHCISHHILHISHKPPVIKKVTPNDILNH